VSALGRLLEQIHEAELDLADDYVTVGERHAADHDVYHLCHSLARQCGRHATKLAPSAERYGEHVEEDDDGPDSWGVVLESMRHKASELLGRRPEAGILLLHDLRRLFLAAENVAALWVMAGQAAQAKRDRELLQVVTECHTETDVQVKALMTHIKVASPQVLAVG
jgi:hypothetical protein